MGESVGSRHADEYRYVKIGNFNLPAHACRHSQDGGLWLIGPIFLSRSCLQMLMSQVRSSGPPDLLYYCCLSRPRAHYRIFKIWKHSENLENHAAGVQVMLQQSTAAAGTFCKCKCFHHSLWHSITDQSGCQYDDSYYHGAQHRWLVRVSVKDFAECAIVFPLPGFVGLLLGWLVTPIGDKSHVVVQYDFYVRAFQNVFFSIWNVKINKSSNFAHVTRLPSKHIRDTEKEYSRSFACNVLHAHRVFIPRYL